MSTGQARADLPQHMCYPMTRSVQPATPAVGTSADTIFFLDRTREIGSPTSFVPVSFVRQIVPRSNWQHPVAMFWICNRDWNMGH